MKWINNAEAYRGVSAEAVGMSCATSLSGFRQASAPYRLPLSAKSSKGQRRISLEEGLAPLMARTVSPTPDRTARTLATIRMGSFLPGERLFKPRPLPMTSKSGSAASKCLMTRERAGGPTTRTLILDKLLSPFFGRRFVSVHPVTGLQMYDSSGSAPV